MLEPETPFLPNWHIDSLVEYLEAVTIDPARLTSPRKTETGNAQRDSPRQRTRGSLGRGAIAEQRRRALFLEEPIR
jgi:hypothetical protein